MNQFYLLGKSLDQYHPMELRAYISNLNQNSFVLCGTLKDNIDPDRLYSVDVLFKALKHFDLAGLIVNIIGSANINDICEFFEGEYKHKKKFNDKPEKKEGTSEESHITMKEFNNKMSTSILENMTKKETEKVRRVNQEIMD